jgi:quercetin dioxygenase-like cupin family protein
MAPDPSPAGVTVHRLDEMVGGWFVGAFDPVALPSADAEVAVKCYPAGAVEAPHVHYRATEVTLVLDGQALMAGRHLVAGDIVVLAPGTPTGFRALTACTTVVVKTPSCPGDKYPAPDHVEA